MKASEATRLLCDLIEREQHPNVCAAAIDVLTEVGTPEALPTLEKCAVRFAATPFLPFAISVAISAHIGRRKLDRDGRFKGRSRRMPSISPRRMSSDSANFSTVAPACRSREGKRYFIDRRLEDRIAATGSSSFQAYFSLLRADADHEIEHLINSFTVNETYFYREDHQLRCMTSSLLGGIVAQKTAGKHRADLVDPVLDGRRALFHRALADGKLAPGRQLQYRDRRIGYRHPGAQGSRRGHLWRPRADAAVARHRQPLFQAGRRRQSSDRRGPQGLHPIHPCQPDRCAGHGTVPRFRPDLLPQRPDIFRRCVAAPGSRKPL